jgi:hypothetical protein
LTAAMTVEL